MYKLTIALCRKQVVTLQQPCKNKKKHTAFQNIVFTMYLMSVLIVPVKVHGPASQHVSNSTMTVSTPTPSILCRGPVIEDHRDQYRKEALRKGKCLSIGIQVFMRQQWGWRDTKEDARGNNGLQLLRHYVEPLYLCFSILISTHKYSETQCLHKWISAVLPVM